MSNDFDDFQEMIGENAEQLGELMGGGMQDIAKKMLVSQMKDDEFFDIRSKYVKKQFDSLIGIGFTQPQACQLCVGMWPK